METGTRPDPALSPFIADGLVERPLIRLASGKEATVWCCEAGPALPDLDFVAAKVYRASDRRAFSGHMHYFQGRFVAGRCARKAIEKRSSVGRKILFAEWIGYEFDTLIALHAAGVDVPRPLACTSNTVLMEFIGDGNGAAPLLHTLSFRAAETRRVLDQLVAHVERMLACNLVHGDLSAYNVLYWRERPYIIDVPQAVDPRSHPGAADFLVRDLERLTDWAAKHGLRVDPSRHFGDLWSRWLNAEL